jgi:DNA polymerase III alpha subunit (gram-positive type)
VTGLATIDGNVFLHEKEVTSVTIASALEEFLEWLSQFDAKVLLVAHNCKTFDSTRLLFHLENANKVEQFCKYVSGFADTRPMFANLFPELPNAKQSTIVSHVLSENYDAHNAINDVHVLCRAINVSKSKPVLQAYSFPVEDTQLAVKRNISVKKWLPALQCMTNKKNEKKAFGIAMAQKIAASGLGFEHLKLAHVRDAEQGIMK